MIDDTPISFLIGLFLLIGVGTFAINGVIALFQTMFESDSKPMPTIESLASELESKPTLRQARKDLFAKFNYDDTSDEYKKAFQELTKEYD